MKIYFAASITGGRDHAHLYPAIVNELKRHGAVLSEHLANQELTHTGEDDIDDTFVHDRDLQWVLEADVLVAEVSQPSLGVGYEIGRAIEHGKRVLCLYYPQEGKRLTRMLTGNKDVRVHTYTTIEDARAHIDAFFGESEMSLLFFRRNGRILLGETLRGPFVGHLNGHGGKQQPEDKSMEDCARRESWEETGGSAGTGGLTVHTMRKLGEMAFSFTYKPTVHRVHIYETTDFSGTVGDTDEMRNAWYDEADIPIEKMMPGDRLWMPLVIAGERFIGTCQYRKDANGMFVVEKHAIKKL